MASDIAHTARAAERTAREEEDNEERSLSVGRDKSHDGRRARLGDASLRHRRSPSLGEHQYGKHTRPPTS
jgi:hypothetical protein